MLSRTVFHRILSTAKVKRSSKCVLLIKTQGVLSRRTISLCTDVCTNKSSSKNPSAVAVRDSFAEVKEKSKTTYLDMVRLFENRDVHRRGHVEFIYSALKHMEGYGVHKDLQVYKALIDVLPKGKFIPTNMFQAEFMHYPKQQQCIVDLLEQMEDNGVMPDYEMEDILMNIFGRQGHPLRKFWRMMYWMPKFKNLSPWPLPNPVPDDVFELAKLAIARITTADLTTTINVYRTSDLIDSVDDTWIVSGQSPVQRELLKGHEANVPLYVEGGFRVWIRNRSVDYFMLRADPKPPVIRHVDEDDVANIRVPFMNMLPKRDEKQLAVVGSVHEQEDGVILALCATGTSSKDSLLSWIRHLEKDGNPDLAHIPTVFTLRSAPSELSVVSDENNETTSKERIDEK